MSGIAIFGFGMAAGMLMIFIIGMVVVMVKLNKRIKNADSLILGLSQSADEDRRIVSDNVSEVQRVLNEEIQRVERVISDANRDTLADSKSYTDSRFDKVK